MIKSIPAEIRSYDMRCVDVDPSELQRFASSGELALEHPRRKEIVLNQYVLLKGGEKQTMPARLDANGTFVRLQIPEVLRIPDGHHLKPLNLGQKCLIDALLNPRYFLGDLLWPGGNRQNACGRGCRTARNVQPPL